ncbi:uncharacterized protein LOC105354687 [Oryzias latipes]
MKAVYLAGVRRKLQITQGPDNTTVAMGTNVSMQCTVSGFPVPMVRWFKDGFLLPNGSASFSLQNNGQLLTFRNVTREDEGFYHCEASNQNQTVQSEPAFLLPAEMGWTFVQEPTNMTVKRGENLTLSCSPPHSRPEARVTWFRNDQLLFPTGHITALPNGDLFFLRVQESDSGSYFCRASNIHLQRFITSTRAAVTVLTPPTVKLHPQVLTVAAGAQAVLECEVSGRPSPSISWVKRGHSKQTGGRVVLGRRTASLHIQSARRYDEAEYLCEASNMLGKSYSAALLRVAVSPIIVTHTDQVVCRTGTVAILPCRAVGEQPITYRWTKDRAGIRSSIPITEDKYISADGDLHISRVQYSDAGHYYCVAENTAGRHQRRTVLAVTGSGSNNMTTSLTSPRKAVAELIMPPETLEVLQQHLNQQATNPTQVLVTQIQPPMLPPPPHPYFQSAELHTPQTRGTVSASVTSEVLDSTVFVEGQTSTSVDAPKRQKVLQELFLRSYPDSSNMSDEFFGPNFDSLNPTSAQSSVTQTWIRPSGPDTELSSKPAAPQLVTNWSFSHFLQTTQAPLPSSSSLTLPQQSFTINVLPKFHLELSTLPSFIRPTVSNVEHGSSPEPRPQRPPSAPKNQVSTPRDDKVLYQTNRSFPLNETEKPLTDKELTDSRSRRNTSQSSVTINDPKGTQQSPSWLPVLEKHDIPVVVGVGVSLAFIFITVTFYSVVQKNEPAQMCRAAQRNLGIPIRHADCRSAGRTYENRAFEDDDCVAVIEQSPNTSDTRTRPPGPCLVTVQMEPTFQELSENALPASVTVETHPEPVTVTKVDSLTEEEKGCSLSQPSIRLQSSEEWTSSRGDTPSLCQETLPPPSSSPSHSISPPPQSRRQEALHSSLTLQSAELSVAPIQHSLSVSHGSPPLLLSHHVSLGLTTVAVDVQFYPAATAPVTVGASTQINSASNSTTATVPLFSPLLVSGHEEDDPSTAKFPARK